MVEGTGNGAVNIGGEEKAVWQWVGVGLRGGWENGVVCVQVEGEWRRLDVDDIEVSFVMTRWCTKVDPNASIQ